MFFLPLIGSNQTANLIWVKLSTWRASIALNWLSLYSNSYFVLTIVIYLQCMHDINLFTFPIIKQQVIHPLAKHIARKTFYVYHLHNLIKQDLSK